MKHGRIKVYHNLKFGYIFCAETTVAGTVMKTVIDPVCIGDPDLTDSQLGVKILETLEKSRDAQPVERSSIKDFKFWQVSGIKGFASFSKKFDCVNVTEEDSQINIIQLVRDLDGAYFVPEGQLPVQLNADLVDLSSELGQEVRKLLTKSPAKETNHVMSFETVYGRKVSYMRPSDEFLDIGDGHTDAYQVFRNEENPKNAILFLLDNGYTQFDEGAVQERWEQLYGELQAFTYCITSGKQGCKIIKVSAKTKNREMIANIYCEKDGQLEVAAQIDRDTSVKYQDRIRTEFNSLVASIQFK